jgi:PAS domain S-box-containing protein
VNVVVFGGLIWVNAFHLHNAEMDRKRAWESLRHSEEALRSSQAKLQGIISSAMDAIISVDEQQRIVVFNRAAETIFRCAASEAIGSTLDRFIPENLREVHQEHIRRFGTQGATNRSMTSPGLLTGIRSSGEAFPIEATISQVQADGEKLYTVILRDVTERKQAEEALSRQAEVLRLRVAALDAAANSIVMTDEKGTIQWVNSAFTKLTGYSAAEAIGQNPGVLKSGKHDVQVYEAMWKTILSGSTWRGEVINRRKDGSLYTEAMTITPIRSVDGIIHHFLAVKEDITERKRAEEALQQSQAQFLTLANAIPQLCWIAHADGHIFWYNERWCEYTGTTPEQMEGWGWQSVHDPDTLPKVLERWKGSIANGKPFDMVFPLRRPHARRRSLLGSRGRLSSFQVLLDAHEQDGRRVDGRA